MHAVQSASNLAECCKFNLSLKKIAFADRKKWLIFCSKTVYTLRTKWKKWRSDYSLNRCFFCLCDSVNNIFSCIVFFKWINFEISSFDCALKSIDLSAELLHITMACIALSFPSTKEMNAFSEQRNSSIIMMARWIWMQRANIEIQIIFSVATGF